MSYDAQLTEAECATFTPNAEVVRYLEATRARLGLEKRDLNVLDWGSGRGEYVLWLREAGYNAFGAEIRAAAALRGNKVFAARGLDFEHLVRPIGSDCRTDLPNGYFHFVFTHYVLEHVADLDAAAREMARLTAPGGSGFHVYPGKLRPIEPHLFMPFVHWLPKSPARKWAIRAYVACGIEPRWGWLSTADAETKTRAYFDFVMLETFYRRFAQVRRSFDAVGLYVTPVSAEHPTLRRLATLPRVLRKPLVEAPVMAFRTVEILVRKPGTSPGSETIQMATGGRTAGQNDSAKQ